MKVRQSILAIILTILTAQLALRCSPKRDEGRPAENTDSAANPDASRSAGEVINQHIVFSGIIALVPLDSYSLRFIAMPDLAMAQHRGMSHTAKATSGKCPPDDGPHRVWIIVPKATSTYPPDRVVCEARSKARVDMVAIEATGQISFPRNRTGRSNRGNLSAIASSVDFAPGKEKIKDGYTRQAGPSEPVAAWGDLDAGIFKATFVEKDRGWYYGDRYPKPPHAVCRRMAQDVCYESRLGTDELVIALEDGAEIRVKPKNKRIDVRIVNAPSPFPKPKDSPVSPDRHFALYRPLFLYEDAPEVIPYLCEDVKPIADAAAPHTHDMDGPTAAEEALLAQGQGGEAGVLSPGAINCPPTWWCPDPPDCE